MTLADALDSDDTNVGKLKVVSLLESLPGVGKVKARKVMEDIGIADNRRVQGLGAQQRQSLLEARALWGVTSTRAGTAPLIIVVSGPGGVGKGTIVDALVARDPRLWLSRTWTTAPSGRASPTTAYVFTDLPGVRAAHRGRRVPRVDRVPRQLLRHADPRSPPAAPTSCSRSRSTAPSRSRRMRPDALLIFVLPPTRDEQERRLRGRGDSRAKVVARLRKAEDEEPVGLRARRPRRGQRRPRDDRRRDAADHRAPHGGRRGVDARSGRDAAAVAIWPTTRPRPGEVPWNASHDTMMNPPIEELLDRVDSKFGLVTLAARRARNINAYFNQLGEGLGHMVPPQVSSVARKPLSIGFEEIAADKIKWVDPVDEPDGAEVDDRRRRRRHDTSES